MGSTGLDNGHVLFLWIPIPLKCKKWPINDKTEWTSLVNKGFTKWFKDYTKNCNTKSRSSFCFSSFDCLQDKLIFMRWTESMFCDANVVETVRTITTGRKKCFSELQTMFVGYKQF